MNTFENILFYLSIPLILISLYEWNQVRTKKKIFSLSFFIKIGIIALTIAIPFILVSEFNVRNRHFHWYSSHASKAYWNIFASSVITLAWFSFLWRIDLFEKERKHHLIIVFLLSIGSMYLLYPLRILLFDFLNFRVPSNEFGEFYYITVSIGVLEELVKIIPVILILRFSKAINEPFDYILYGSISALAFSFIENMEYFDSSLSIIAVRGIYCCIVHMTLTATVSYGMMLAKFRGYNKFLLFGGFFLIAAVIHGTYDFVLMSYFIDGFEFLSGVIVILMICLWIFYVNNTLNVSPFYDRKKEFSTASFQYQIILIGVIVLMTEYLVLGLVSGPNRAMRTLEENVYSYSFFIILAVYCIGRMQLIQGYVANFNLPILNRAKRIKKDDQSGSTFLLMPSDNYVIKSSLVPKSILGQEVSVLRRQIVEERLDTYLIELSQPHENENFITDKLLLVPTRERTTFCTSNKIVSRLYLIPENLEGSNYPNETKPYTYLGKLFSKKIVEIRSSIPL
jgi:RsiW-degrading membrane proteinase PrsW (M82 family)